MLSADQVSSYREQGYLVVEGLLDAEEVATLRQVTDAFIEGARGLSANNDIYDLEESHTADAPRVRRIKVPHRQHAAYAALVRNPRVLAVLRDLLGPDLRLHGTKLNMKAAGYGAAVDWHQDWAFYPHTNDDVLAVGLMMDDMAPENGPLLVVPGSHRGPVYDHHYKGVFSGSFDVRAEGVDLSKAVALTGGAGSASFHHVRLVHGSAQNVSNRARRLLLMEYTAADAWPLMALGHYNNSLDEYHARLVAGTEPETPRVEPVPVRIPLPQAPDPGSIYAIQRSTRRQEFVNV